MNFKLLKALVLLNIKIKIPCSNSQSTFLAARTKLIIHIYIYITLLYSFTNKTMRRTGWWVVIDFLFSRLNPLCKQNNWINSIGHSWFFLLVLKFCLVDLYNFLLLLFQRSMSVMRVYYKWTLRVLLVFIVSITHTIAIVLWNKEILISGKKRINRPS